MAPMATGHDNSKHLLIVYGIVPLCWGHAVRLKGNRLPVTLSRQTLDTRGIICAIAAVFLPRQNDASHGYTRVIRL
jgi:hypothetical protein